MRKLTLEEVKERLARDGKIENCYCGDAGCIPEPKHLTETALAVVNGRIVWTDGDLEMGVQDYVWVDEPKERKPWTLEALKEKGWPIGVEFKSGQIAFFSAVRKETVLFANDRAGNGATYAYEEMATNPQFRAIILADGTTLLPYQDL